MCVSKLYGIFVILANVVSNEGIIDYYFTNVECENYLPEVMYNVSCNLTSNKTFHADLMLTQDIKNLTARFYINIVRGSSTFNLASVEMDVCEALGSRQSYSLIRMITEMIRQMSNLPLGCPLKKNTLYSMDGFFLKKDYIPSYTPSLDWKSDAIFYVNLRKIYRIITTGHVDQFYIRKGR